MSADTPQRVQFPTDALTYLGEVAEWLGAAPESPYSELESYHVAYVEVYLPWMPGARFINNEGFWNFEVDIEESV